MKKIYHITTFIITLLASQALDAMNNNNHHNYDHHNDSATDTYYDGYYYGFFTSDLFDLPEMLTLPPSVDDEIVFDQAIYNTTDNNDNDQNAQLKKIYPAIHEQCYQDLNSNNNTEDSLLMNAIRGYQPETHEEKAIIKPPLYTATKEESSFYKNQTRDNDRQLDEEEPEDKQRHTNEQSQKGENGTPEPRAQRKRNHTCTYEGCSKTFTKVCGLTRHIRRHTGKRPFKCPYEGCTKAFALKGTATSHIKTHTNAGLYKCSEDGCSQTFAKGSHLTQHMRIHTGEKPFVCTVHGCNRAFSQRGNLTRHMGVHTGERPYKCTQDGCNQAFGQKSNLNVHIKSHRS